MALREAGSGKQGELEEPHAEATEAGVWVLAFGGTWWLWYSEMARQEWWRSCVFRLT